MTDEMEKALRADGEKLKQLTGEDHGPFMWCPCEYAPCYLPECREHGCMCDPLLNDGATP